MASAYMVGCIYCSTSKLFYEKCSLYTKTCFGTLFFKTFQVYTGFRYLATIPTAMASAKMSNVSSQASWHLALKTSLSSCESVNSNASLTT